MMIDRFLSYSLRWACPIKLVYLKEGQMKTGNLTVVSLAEDSFEYTTARRKTPQTMPMADVLAASYARGDDGDTLKKERQAQEKETDEG